MFDLREESGSPVFWSPDMKHQHPNSPQDVEKMTRFLDEYQPRQIEATGEAAEDSDEKNGEESQNLSPSSRFFLTK
jgi:hypothetical protein